MAPPQRTRRKGKKDVVVVLRRRTEASFFRGRIAKQHPKGEAWKKRLARKTKMKTGMEDDRDEGKRL